MNRVLDMLLFFGTILILYVGMVWLSGLDFGPTVAGFHPKALAATGFIILAAFTMGEFFKLLNIPALLGYIVAGVLFGPNLGPLLPFEFPTLFGNDVISDLELVNVLTVGVIGTMGGGELKIEDIKENIKTILMVVGIFLAVAVAGTWVTVMLLYDFAPSIVPFLEGRPIEHAYGAALLLAVFAVAMSPAATLAILQETKASGKFSSLVLGTVIIADLVLVAMVLVGKSFVAILISPEGFSMAKLLEKLPVIGAEFGSALVIGAVVGVVFIGYLRWIKRELLFVTVLIIFATYYVAQTFHAEILLAFLTAGFIVQNFSKHGHDMIHALEKISLPVFVIYFMREAAKLDLQAVIGFIWLTLILTAVRAIALFIGGRLGAHLAGANPTTKRYLWLAFFSRGGVDLVLAGAIARDISPWGTELQTVIVAVVVVHIVAGPPLLKLALDWAEETEGSRQTSREEAEAFEQLPAVGEVSSLGASFPIPNFEDDGLNDRVLQLRELIVKLHREIIVEPLEEKTQALHASMRNAAEELDEAFERLENILSSDEFESETERAEAIKAAHIKYLSDIEDNVETYERINPEIVHHERIFQLLEEIRDIEDFETVYRLQMEDFLYEPQEDDGVVVRFLKAGRRLQRSMTGRPTRSVPLGRLWRYFVELTVPRMLARAAFGTATLNERFWADLGNHMRRADDLFDDVFDTILLDTTHRDKVPEVEDEEEERLLSGPRFALDRVREGRKAGQERAYALREQLDETAGTALDRYTVALRETFSNFLDAVAHAGTSQLPTWRYRPSAQFDRARRAESSIRSRLAREVTVVTGQRGWIVVEYQLILFLYWLEQYEEEVRGTLDSMIANPVGAQLALLRSACHNLPGELGEYDDVEAVRDWIEQHESATASWPAVDWDAWLDEEIRPALVRAQKNLQRMLALYAQGHAARRLLELLERRVSGFSDEIVLMSEHPDLLDPEAVVPTLEIPLREWFASEVVRETALRLVEFDERGEVVIRRALEALEDIEQVLEFNLRTADRDTDEGADDQGIDLATSGLERAGRMIDDLREDLRRGFSDLTAWIVGETSEIAERAAEPFLQHRPAEIERLMRRRGQTSLAERGENWVMSTLNRGVSIAKGTARRYGPVAREVLDEVGALFVEEQQPTATIEIRRRLHPHERDEPNVPGIYRRLFMPVPLDIADFYIGRPEVEQTCAGVVREWEAGLGTSLLVCGDRGIGKRSTIHHILQNDVESLRLLEGVRVHNVVLEDDMRSEAELVAKIGSVLPRQSGEAITTLSRLLDTVDGRHVIVLEHAEKLYNRTEEGLARAKSFLRAMNDSNERILWIVLMGTPATLYLDTAIGFRDYFTHCVEVGPLDAGAIEQMIKRRHRVSGFQASFERARPRIRDWLRHPIDTSDALRDPRAEYFRNLARLSGGNPMRALLYWLDSVSLDVTDDHFIWVRSAPQQELELVGSLSLVKRLILAALVQHRTLTALQLRTILRRDFEAVATELSHLERLGFVEQIAGRNVVAWELRPEAEGIVTSELRLRNMI